MSANTAIKEGGNPHSFGPVDYLRVASGSGQYALWVPESERALTTKSIDKNGIYRASDDGVYGWSSVSVNVPAPDSVTGKDGDGDEVVVKPDPDTGVLEEEKVPSSIEITTPPTKLIYTDGETIDFTGAVVKAYLETGGEYGVVPNGEITLNPTTAIYNSSTYHPMQGTATHDGKTVTYSDTVTWTFHTIGSSQSVRTDVVAHSAGYCVAINDVIYAFMDGQAPTGSGYSTTYWVSGETTSYDFGMRGSPHSKTVVVDGVSKTIYYQEFNGAAYGNSSMENFSGSLPKTSYTPEEVAEILFAGDRQETPAGSTQTITVSWPRPGDGAILETSFGIDVQQSFGSTSGGGSQAGETGAGRND